MGANLAMGANLQDKGLIQANGLMLLISMCVMMIGGDGTPDAAQHALNAPSEFFLAAYALNAPSPPMTGSPSLPMMPMALLISMCARDGSGGRKAAVTAMQAHPHNYNVQHRGRTVLGRLPMINQ